MRYASGSDDCAQREAFVFRRLPHFTEPRKTPIQEDAPLQPTNAYGESKVLVERMLDCCIAFTVCAMPACVISTAAGAAGEQGEDHHPESP